MDDIASVSRWIHQDAGTLDRFPSTTGTRLFPDLSSPDAEELPAAKLMGDGTPGWIKKNDFSPVSNGNRRGQDALVGNGAVPGTEATFTLPGAGGSKAGGGTARLRAHEGHEVSAQSEQGAMNRLGA